MRKTTLAALVLAAAACGRADNGQGGGATEAAARLGGCTQEEPGTIAVAGRAVHGLDRTQTAGDAAEGRFAVTITCMTPGAGGSAVALILPNLQDSLPPAGRYRIHAPGVLPPRDGLARLAWAQALVPTSNGLAYRAMGGELVIEKVERGVIVGSYLLALERAPEAEPRGPDRLVLGGAFEAPRGRTTRDGDSPGGGR